MPEPRVLGVMLTANRTEMTRRAVASFVAQTYANKKLLIWDTGELNADFCDESGLVNHIPAEAYREITIGALRNEANSFWTEYDIVIHFDSDDWSHPNRITEQVALLQASGKQCVGYRDMLFWRLERGLRQSSRIPASVQADPYRPSEAWLYTNQDPRYCLGTSMCYWRAAWEARPFPDISRGEDRKWLREIDSLGVTSLPETLNMVQMPEGHSKPLTATPCAEPRMIASIHSGNHVKYETTSAEWKRVPEWDSYCRERMAL